MELENKLWDAIIVGDGSGSRWGQPGGWAAIIFDKYTKQRKTLFGALSDSTINICELSPYLYAVHWYVRGPGKELQKKKIVDYRAIEIHIATDCEIIAKQGNHRAVRDANAPLWAAMDSFSRHNYKLHWHYFDRNTLKANSECDALSKDMRKLVGTIEDTLVTTYTQGKEQTK